MRMTLSLAAGGVALAMLAGCATEPMPVYGSSYPAYPASTAPVAGIEYGRIVGIQYLPAGSNVAANPGGSNVLGAVVGGLLGGVLGNQIGSGGGRAAATVLGAVGGAAVGNRIARDQRGYTTAPGYRITMQTDQGYTRVYEVPATGDLRVGDRVRVDNGVIYRA